MPSIQKLPNEILVMVFAACILAGKPHATTLFTLMAVCSHWREVAMSRRTLWSQIAIDLDDQSNVELSTSLLLIFLGRSVDLPVTLMLKVETTDIVPYLPLLDLLRADDYSGRWRDLDLDMPFGMMQRLFDGTANFRSLRYLRLCTEEGSLEGPLVLDTPINIVNAHALQCVHLRLLPAEFIPKSCVKLPVAQLTSCRGIVGNAQELLELLSQAPFLVHCSLIYIPDVHHKFSLSPVRVPDLRTLTIIAGAPPIDIMLFLQNLSLPSLQSLTIKHLEDQLIPAQEEALLSFLRYHRSITNLSFVKSAITLSLLQKCLHSMPSIVDLQVRMPPSCFCFTADLVRMMHQCQTLKSWVIDFLHDGPEPFAHIEVGGPLTRQYPSPPTYPHYQLAWNTSHQ